MLQNLEQTFDKDGWVVFTVRPIFKPHYNPRFPENLNAVIEGLASDSSQLLLVNFYTSNTAMYMSDTDIESPIKLVVDDGDDFTRVLKALKTNTHLVELCLYGYTITDEQAKELGEALAIHPSIQTLGLFYTTASINAIESLTQGIAKNKQIHSLYFCESTFGGAAWEKIDNALKNNQFITKIDTNNVRYNTPQYNRQHQSSFERPIRESITRNQEFWKQRRLLEEKFILLEELKIIPKDPKRNEYDLLLKRNKTGQSENFSKEKIISELGKRLLPGTLLNASNSSGSSFQDVYQNLSEENILAFVSLFEEMAAIVENLKQQGFQEWRNLLERVKQAEAYFYLMSDQIILFFDLYRDYFRFPGNAKIDVEFAERILNSDNTDADRHTLALLGLQDEHLRFQYVIKLVEGNLTPGAARLRKSAYCKLHNIYDDLNVPSLEEAIGVDRILTNYELLLLCNALNAIRDQYLVGAIRTLKISTEFKIFYDFIQGYYKLAKADKEKGTETLNKLLDAIPNSHEKYAAQIFREVSEGKKIALYSQLRQKQANEPVKRLEFTELNDGKPPILNLQEFTPSYPILGTKMDRVDQQVHLKHTLAQNLGYSVYETVFDLPSTKTITREHSRILSATRLARLSSDFSHEKMIKILQVEYAALPDDDKKATASFFTSYRHRTLEKALEAVFEKESISAIDNNTLNANENLAFAILQWIGDQERSFYYKTSKNPILFAAIQRLGDIAHKIIACDKPEALTMLKQNVKEELDKLPFFINVTFLTEKLQPDHRVLSNN